MKKIAIVFGTRPEAIKLAPLIRALAQETRYFSLCTIATAQHRSMLDDVLRVFEIVPQHDLGIMTEGQTLSQLSERLLVSLEAVFAKESPDLVVVQGDTTTTFIASLAAFYQKIPVAHVEAGLRTGDLHSPYPEELNRKLTSGVADLHFAPTHVARRALEREGISRAKITVTGNTVIDALHSAARTTVPVSHTVLGSILRSKKRLIVVTIHRRENWGDPLVNACHALRTLAEQHPDVVIVFPVHLNPKVRETVFSHLSHIENVHLIDPLNYLDFVQLMKRAYFVITDSGGIQEEAPALGIPVLVLRSVTERPEAVKFGTVKLIGTESEKIVQETTKLLTQKKSYQRMASSVNPYGDGKSTQRIITVLKLYFGFSRKKVREFDPQ